MTGSAQAPPAAVPHSAAVPAGSSASGDGPCRWPAVTAVVCTRNRPDLLARAVAAILAQDYPGTLECLVVYDNSTAVPLDLGELPAARSVRVLENLRTPGLAGARNTGLLAAQGELIAFCDDDDEWRPGKISAQVGLWRQRPEAALVCTALTIVTAQGSVVRVAPAVVTREQLVRSRVAELHPSSFLIRRTDLLERAGLVDEQVPFSYGEDYELMLRLARLGPIATVPEPLTTVYWNRQSHFSTRWEGIAAGLTYLLERFPEFDRDRTGRARLRGQVAFAHAADRRTALALRWALATLRDDPRQLRAYAALGVACRLVSAETLLSRVNARGRGL